MNNKVNKKISDIINIIKTFKNKELRSQILKKHPYDVSRALNKVEYTYKDKVFNVLSIKEISDIFEYFKKEDLKGICLRMDPMRLGKIISNMKIDDAVDLIKTFDKSLKIKVIRWIDKDVREKIIRLSQYTETQAASIMVDDFLCIESTMTAGQAMSYVVKESSDTEVIDVLFVVDEDGVLIGNLELKDLIISRKKEKIIDIMNSNIKSITVNSDLSKGIEMMNEYGLIAMPVTMNNELMGIITLDDAMDFIDDAMDGDYNKMAGIIGDSDDSLKSVLKSRTIWLFVLVILSLVLSLVINGFSKIINAVTALVFFQTMILDMAGNTGTQSLATTVVAISQNDLDDKKKIRKHIKNEIIAGLLNSIILGIASFIVAFAFSKIMKLDVDAIVLGIVIGSSLVIGLTISNFIGAIIPLILNKLKIDPALASGPFISTINDIIGVGIYYLLATAFLMGGII